MSVSLIKYHLDKAQEINFDFDYMDRITKKLMPLIQHCFPHRHARWCSQKEECRDHEYYQRTLCFGTQINYSEYMESPRIHSKVYFNDKDTWISYEYLQQLRRDIELSRDFFRQKILYHEKEDKRNKQHKNKTRKILSDKHQERDLHLLDRRLEHAEIRALRGDITKATENWIYTREKVDHALKCILTNLSKGSSFYSLDPLSFELDLRDLDKILCLKIVWTENATEILSLKSFREPDEGKNMMQEFTVDLLDKGRAFANYKCSAGASVSRYLERIGLVGILKKLFIIHCGGDEARLKRKRIEFSELTSAEIQELFDLARTLEFIAWDYK